MHQSYVMPPYTQIKTILKAVVPGDDTEKEHIADALQWIDTGVEIYRIERPAIPLKHIVSYTVLYDQVEKKILLLFHNKALRLLPNGGHPEKGEMPHCAALRELQEEMGLNGEFILTNDMRVPFFISQVVTGGIEPGHTDVDLWCIFKGDSTKPLNHDLAEFKREFGDYGWYTFNEIESMKPDQLDENMLRFVRKLREAVN